MGKGTGYDANLTRDRPPAAHPCNHLGHPFVVRRLHRQRFLESDLLATELKGLLEDSELRTTSNPGVGVIPTAEARACKAALMAATVGHYGEQPTNP